MGRLKALLKDKKVRRSPEHEKGERMAELKYAQAMARLNEIISCIENEEIDVDELSRQVKEAVKLVRVCREKIEKAEMEVKSAVEAFQADRA